WAPVDGADGYHAVTWPGGATCTAAGQEETTCTVTGLPGGVAVQAWVVSTTSDGTISSAAGPSDAVRPLSAPQAPESLEVEVDRRGSDVDEEVFATVRWEPPAGDGGLSITGYEVELTQDDGGAVSGSEAGCTDVSGDTTTCELTDLTEDADYRVTVAATNDRGTGPTAEVAFTAGTPPLAPTAPAATDLRTGGEIEVSWTASTTDTVTGHRARARPVPVEDGEVRTCEAEKGTDECSIDGLVNGAEYDIEVVALNAAGSSPAADEEERITPTGPPGPPTDVFAEPGDAQATVRWTAPDDDGGVDLTAYEVQIVDDDTSNPGCTADAPDTSCTVTGLTNGALYSFTVTATNDDGEDRTSPASDPSAAVTPATTPDAPTDVTATPLDDGSSVEVTWTAPADDGGSPLIEMEAKAVPTEGGVDRTCSADPEDEGCTITGLPSDTEVEVTVRASNDLGPGAPSTAETVITAADPDSDEGDDTGGEGGSSGGSSGGVAPAPTEPEESSDSDAPEPVSFNGSLPSLRGGLSSLLVDDRSRPATTSTTITAVQLSGVGTTTQIATAAATGVPAPVRDGLLTLPPGGTVTIRSTGLAAGTPAALWLFSEPRLLGTGTVGPDGEVEIEASLPGQVERGGHTLQLVGTTAGGEVTGVSVGVEVGDLDPRFSDVALGTTHWLAIERLAEQGVALGGTDGRYRPSAAVNRGQMAAFLDRLLGLPDPGEGTSTRTVPLSDVAGSEHEASIRRLVAAGIASGFTDGTYRPGEPVRRGQMATFLANAAGLGPVTSGAATDVAGNTHEQAIHAVMTAGIASGFSDGTYRPERAVTRAQMATLLVGLDDTLTTAR
ncbi:MAG: fibronectin type III domain-containing protein, partial [Nitriliruptoraceae bacterium]